MASDVTVEGEGPWVIELADVRDPLCEALLRDYYVDVSDRWYQHREGRDSTPEEIETGFPQMRSDDLAPPTGEFVVARRADDAAVIGGCVGVRLLRDDTGSRVAELRRFYVRPEHRRAGLGGALLACAEEIARVWGVPTMRLDTRLDLREARALYLRHGWVEVPAFSDAFYAEVWYAKPLG
ncbi:GNAT family N-acetyltransferase [Terrabacter aerolatus]|uniref:N-acetyltransferase n=1 Tax=Terrabacter aerolatus TaxID=422442 RepID=A0A512D423_9MICO|nr:GNAT family N-acetyltransferase [Terrabacter aerolatus]GEO31197.1 N-acetyltransferase [Terrabacter aerolatus]